MKKKLIIIITFILSITININNVYAKDFDITSKEVILYNMNDNKVLYELESNKKVAVASLTKIMTTIIAIEQIKNLDEEVKITSNVFKGINGYSTAGFNIGDKVTYKDLLYGIMLPSGADAVNAIILNTTNNEEAFIKLMNDKVKELNLKNTHFDNAIGMDTEDARGNIITDFKEYTDSGNYSTASDIAEILKYSLKNKVFSEIFTTKKYTVKNTGLTFYSTLNSYSSNTNIDVSKITGAKSGFTDGAGYCLASTANINDVEYLLIVLGSSTTYKSNAIKDTTEIYNYYSNNYSYQTITKKGDPIYKIPIKLGKIKEYIIKSPETVTLYLKNDIDKKKIEYKYSGIKELNYKKKKGIILGNVKIIYDNEELYKLNIYLNEEIKYYHPLLYTLIGLFTIILLLLIKRKFTKKKKRKKRRNRKVSTRNY